MRTRATKLFALGAVAAVTLAACGDDSNDAASTTAAAPATTMAPETTVAELGTIVDVAVAAGDFTTLVAAVEAAGLVETLSGPGPFTVFAPTDAAFAKLPAGTVEALLKDKVKLRAILTYHVVAGKVEAKDVVKLTSATTVNGAAVTIKVVNGTVMINSASVTGADVQASNGVIHVIDTVILPPL